MPQKFSPPEPISIRLRNILFATDFSKTSDIALPYAAAFARHFNSTIYVVHVISPEEGAQVGAGTRDAAFLPGSGLDKSSNILPASNARTVYWEGSWHPGSYVDISPVWFFAFSVLNLRTFALLVAFHQMAKRAIEKLIQR
jgi:Universal stress protein family